MQIATMNSYSQKIIEQVTALDAARFYGLKVNRNQYVRCPFHYEKTASLKIYPGDRGWYCFGCHEGGNVISLVQKLFNLSYTDAIRKINIDFNLGLPIDQRLTKTQRMMAGQKSFKRIQERILHERELEEARAKYEKLQTFKSFLDAVITLYAPRRPESMEDDALEQYEFNELWAAAVHRIPEIEWRLEEAEINLYELEHR